MALSTVVAVVLGNQDALDDEQRRAVILGLSAVITVVGAVVSGPAGGRSWHNAGEWQPRMVLDWDTGIPPVALEAWDGDLDARVFYGSAIEASGPVELRVGKRQAAIVVANLLREAAHDERLPLKTTLKELCQHNLSVDSVLRERVHWPRSAFWNTRRFPVPRPYKVFVLIAVHTAEKGDLAKLRAETSRWLAEWPKSTVVMLIVEGDVESGLPLTQRSTCAEPSVPEEHETELRMALGMSAQPEIGDLLDRLDRLPDKAYHRLALPGLLYGQRAVWLAGALGSLWVAALIVALVSLLVAALALMDGQAIPLLRLLVGTPVLAVLFGAAAMTPLIGLAVAALVLTWPNLLPKHRWATCTTAAFAGAPFVFILASSLSDSHWWQAGLALVLTAYFAALLQVERDGGFLAWAQEHLRLLIAGTSAWIVWLTVPISYSAPASTLACLGLLLGATVPLLLRRPSCRGALATVILVGALYAVALLMAPQQQSYDLQQVLAGASLAAALMLVTCRLALGQTQRLAANAVLAPLLALPLTPQVVSTLRQAEQGLAERVVPGVGVYTVLEHAQENLTEAGVRVGVVLLACSVAISAFRRAPAKAAKLHSALVALLILVANLSLYSSSNEPLANVLLVTLAVAWLSSTGINGQTLVKAALGIVLRLILCCYLAAAMVLIVLMTISPDDFAWETLEFQAWLPWRLDLERFELLRAIGMLLAAVLLVHPVRALVIRVFRRSPARDGTEKPMTSSNAVAALAFLLLTASSFRLAPTLSLLSAAVSSAALVGVWLALVRRFPGSVNPVALVLGVGSVAVTGLHFLVLLPIVLTLLGGPAESSFRQVGRPTWRSATFAVLLGGLLWVAVATPIPALLIGLLAAFVLPADPSLVPWSVTRERHLRLRTVATFVGASSGVALALLAGILSVAPAAPGDRLFVGAFAALGAGTFGLFAIAAMRGWVMGGWFLTSCWGPQGISLPPDEVRWAMVLNTLAERNRVSLNGALVQVLRHQPNSL